MTDHDLLEKAARYVAAEHFIPENAQLLARRALGQCPTCGSDEPKVCRYRSTGIHGHGDYCMADDCCPDPFHGGSSNDD